MKILQIINSLGTGGAEKLLLDTIPLYVQNGLEMDILVFWNNDHQFINSLKKINCCKVYILKESAITKDIYNPLHILKIKKFLKSYDIAHVHLFPAQYFVPLANILNGNKTKLIFTEHNTSNNRIKNSILRKIDTFFYKRFSKQICISEEIKDIFYNTYKFPKEFYPIIKNGVNLDTINKAKAINRQLINSSINVEDKLLLQISAFREQKDQDTVIRALLNLPDNFKLILVGDGVRRIICEELAKGLGVAERVIFLGQRMDVPQIMKSVDYIILSSKYEGLSLASIEGLASGKPFLASDVPGLSEIVGGAGILFELYNDKQLASKILELEGNQNLKQKVINNSIERSQEYHIDKMIQAHIGLYNEVYEK
ncbi:glycosyltransferase [Empedobacter falsenii]